MAETKSNELTIWIIVAALIVAAVLGGLYTFTNKESSTEVVSVSSMMTNSASPNGSSSTSTTTVQTGGVHKRVAYRLDEGQDYEAFTDQLRAQGFEVLQNPDSGRYKAVLNIPNGDCYIRHEVFWSNTSVNTIENISRSVKNICN